MTLTRRPIEIKTKMEDCANNKQQNTRNSLTLGNATQGMAQCRFSVCSLNVSPANHIAACGYRSQAESRGGGCAGGGR